MDKALVSVGCLLCALAAALAVPQPDQPPAVVSSTTTAMPAPVSLRLAPVVCERMIDEPSVEPENALARQSLPPAKGAILGRLADGMAPGFGEAWIVHAFRLNASRTAAVEQRQVYVEPDGSLSIQDLTPGQWQIALVAPQFAWGQPVSVTGDAPVPVRLAPGPTGQLRIETIADAEVSRDTPLALSLVAIRSPELAETPLCIGAVLATHELRMGECWQMDELGVGTYEVRAEVANANAQRSERPRLSERIVVARGETTRLELRFDAPPSNRKAALMASAPDARRR